LLEEGVAERCVEEATVEASLVEDGRDDVGLADVLLAVVVGVAKRQIEAVDGVGPCWRRARAMMRNGVVLCWWRSRGGLPAARFTSASEKKPHDSWSGRTCRASRSQSEVRQAHGQIGSK